MCPNCTAGFVACLLAPKKHKKTSGRFRQLASSLQGALNCSSTNACLQMTPHMSRMSQPSHSKKLHDLLQNLLPGSGKITLGLFQNICSGCHYLVFDTSCGEWVRICALLNVYQDLPRQLDWFGQGSSRGLWRSIDLCGVHSVALHKATKPP